LPVQSTHQNFNSVSFDLATLFFYEVDTSLWVTRIFMILSLGTTLPATLFAFYGALKEEAVKTSSKVGGNFIGAGEYVTHSAL